MAELAALVSPGQFKARKKEPERMLADFNLYVRSIKDLITVVGKEDASEGVKKAMIRSIGGKDMIYLFDHVGKVAAEDTFEQALRKIQEAMTKQTNQAMIKFKLFTGMPQEEEAFSVWWTQIKEQAEKCDFTGYDQKHAARDAILFQTSNNKLRKRILAEDCDLEAVVKLGLALEHSESKADTINKKTDTEVRQLNQLEEEIAKLKTNKKGTSRIDKKCTTCPRGQHPPGKCKGKESKECYTCGQTVHFKGAAVCTKKRVKEEKKGSIRKVQQDADSESTSNSSDTESLGRVCEEVVATHMEGKENFKVNVGISPRSNTTLLGYNGYQTVGYVGVCCQKRIIYS